MTDPAEIAPRLLPWWQRSLARLCWEWTLLTYFDWRLGWGWWNTWAAKGAGRWCEHDAVRAHLEGWR